MSRKIYDLIDINWIQSAIEQINQGQKLKTILSNVQLTDGRIIPSISKKTFHLAIKSNGIPDTKFKPGRKPIEPPEELLDTVNKLHQKVKKIGISRAYGRIITDKDMLIQRETENANHDLDDLPISQLNTNPIGFSNSSEYLSEYTNSDSDSSAEKLFSSNSSEEDPQIESELSEDPYIVHTETTQNLEKSTDYFNKKLLETNFSERTVKKCFKILNIVQPAKNSVPKGKTKYEAVYINLIWHVNIHFFKHRQGEYLYAVIDDKSRKILAWAHLETKEAAQTSRVIDQCFQKYGKPFAIWSDNGTENFGFFRNLLQNANVQSITILPHCPYMNGKIERFWQNVEIEDATWNDIQSLIENYNSNPHTSLPKNPTLHTWYTPNKFYEISEKYDSSKLPLWIVDGVVKDLRESIRNFNASRRNQRN